MAKDITKVEKTQQEKVVATVNNVLAGDEKLRGITPLNAKASNFAEFSGPIIKYELMRNDFLNAMVNKIGKTIVLNKIKDNPLRLLKKGDVPLGSDVEEIFTAMAESKPYDSDGQGLLSVTKPDVQVIYHRRNVAETYSVSWMETEIKEAFTSFEKLTELISGFIDTLYAGAYDKEYQYTKQLIAEGVQKGLFVTKEVVLPTDTQTSKDFVKEIKKDAKMMTFNGKKYNKAQLESGVVTPVKTFTKADQLVLLIRVNEAVEVDVETFATAFNLSKTDFNAIEYIIEVDDFTAIVKDETDEEVVIGDDIVAILADRATFQIYDNDFSVPPVFYNAHNQTQKAYLHVWQTYSISTFSNAIVLKEKQ